MRVFVLSSLLLVFLTGCAELKKYPEGYGVRHEGCDAACAEKAPDAAPVIAEPEFEDFAPLESLEPLAPVPLSTFDESDFREHGLK